MAEGLQAGRALDARVAEKVMGWVDVQLRPIANAYGQHVIDEYAGRSPGSPPQQNALVPRYSTAIQDAWSILERLRGQFQFVALISGKGPAEAPQPWVCKMNKDGAFIEVKGDSAPLAICLAALKAIGEAV